MPAKQTKPASQASATELLKALDVASVNELNALLEKGRQAQAVEEAQEVKGLVGIDAVTLEASEHEGLTSMTLECSIASAPLGFKGEKARGNAGQPKYGEGRAYVVHDGHACVVYYTIGGTASEDAKKAAQEWQATQS